LVQFVLLGLDPALVLQLEVVPQPLLSPRAAPNCLHLCLQQHWLRVLMMSMAMPEAAVDADVLELSSTAEAPLVGVVMTATELQ
jgi:hypothetical protein